MSARLLSRRLSLPLGFLALCASPLLAQRGARKFIASGTGPPTAEFIRQHIAAMEQEPFDGVVLQFKYESHPFRHTAIDTARFKGDVADLKATTFHRFTDNFVLVETTADSGWDWFNDATWKATEANIRLFARAAKAGGLAGFGLDYESYGVNPWKYAAQPRQASYSFPQFADQVRSRGAAFMRAIQDEFPDIKIIAFYQLGYLSPIAGVTDSAARVQRLATSDHGLLVPFLNGMLSAAGPAVTILDGNETRSYYYDTKDKFAQGADIVHKDALPLIEPSLRPVYQHQVQIAQGVFLDYVLGLYQHGKDTTNSRLTRRQQMMWLMHNVYYALRHSDQYAWLYYEKINLWKDSVPADVLGAIGGARERIDKGQPLGFMIEPVLTKEKRLP